MKNILRIKKGFTLIEMMIVVEIIGLLAAIVIPDLIETQKEAQIEACKVSLRGVQSALELYNTHFKFYPQKLEELISAGYLPEGSNFDP